MSKWAYEMDPAELVENMAKACANAGRSNSGYVIDIKGSDYARMASYFKGVVLARLTNKKPPFSRNQKVICRRHVRSHRDDLDLLVEVGRELTVYRIWYLGVIIGQDCWSLELEEVGDGELRPRYDTLAFEAVAAEAAAPTA